MYFSNTDVNRRRLSADQDETDLDFDDSFDEPDNPRRQLDFVLPRSQFKVQFNRAEHGSGFVYARNRSTVAFKSQNMLNNHGKEGGVVALFESSFHMERSFSFRNSADNHGGFLAAINSVYHMEKSVIEEGEGTHGCVIFA